MAFWGTTISGAGHAAAIGLAVWALPWLRAGPDPGVPVVTVRLVEPADLVRAEPEPPPAAEPPLPAPEPPVPAPLREATVPHAEAPSEAPPAEDFAGRFDPDAPLGLQGQGEGSASAPPAAEETTPEKPGIAQFVAEVAAAVERAKVYPETARRRGLFGTTRVALRIGPAGEVSEVRVIGPSGAKALDDAALAAVRNARMPVPPGEVAVSYDLGISFTLRDK